MIRIHFDSKKNQCEMEGAGTLPEQIAELVQAASLFLNELAKKYECSRSFLYKAMGAGIRFEDELNGQEVNKGEAQ